MPAAPTTASARVVERKLHAELRTRIRAAGFHVERFYRVYAPDPDGAVEVLFRGYRAEEGARRVEPFTALVAHEEVAVARGW